MTYPVQESFENFENLKFDPFESKKVLLDDSNGPDKTTIVTFKSLTSNIISHQSILSSSEKLHINLQNFSMIYLNIRSAKKNIEKLKDFLSQTGSFYKVLCLTEIWFDDINTESSPYLLQQYTAIHQHRSLSHKSGWGGGTSMYIHDLTEF